MAIGKKAAPVKKNNAKGAKAKGAKAKAKAKKITIAKSENVTLVPNKFHEFNFKQGTKVIGRMFASLPGTGGAAGNDQFDTGLFKIKDGGTLVGRLWVRKVGSVRTEFWGLAASYTFPSSSSGDKTYTYTYLSSPTYGDNDQQAFKDDCNALFTGQTVTFLTCVPASF